MLPCALTAFCLVHDIDIASLSKYVIGLGRTSVASARVSWILSHSPELPLTGLDANDLLRGFVK